VFPENLCNPISENKQLKPDNIIVIERKENRNFVKLLDFGLARSQNLSRLTGTGEILGTINYLSPEQISRQEYTPSGDIYSLGVVFYEMITMEKPFIGEIPVDIIRQILDKEPIPPLRYRPDLEPGVEELILEMMDKSPAGRPSGEYFCQTLQRMNREITQ
jgi:eukaryotic-like serine/threonine-protein kinase